MTDLWRKSAAELASLVRSRQVSAKEVTEDALARLAQVNPAINAVVTEFPDEALQAAQHIDDQLARQQPVCTLAGVPVTVKTNVDQAGHSTTNGVRLQRDLKAEIDNPVVANLRKAGAVIIGRTNTPAFSLRWFTRNSLHGHTHNPWSRSITPGGSSGGARPRSRQESAPSRTAPISRARSAIRRMPAASMACVRRSAESRT